MHDETPNPLPLSNAVCMHCGYDISGTSLNADGLVTCPECGTELIRSTRTLLTKRDIHSELIRTFIVIFGIWTALTALLAMPFHDSIVGGIVVMSYIFIYPIALPITFIVEWTRLHRDTTPHPRPYPRWTIPLWTLAYTIPSLVFYIVKIVMMERVL